MIVVIVISAGSARRNRNESSFKASGWHATPPFVKLSFPTPIGNPAPRPLMDSRFHGNDKGYLGGGPYRNTPSGERAFPYSPNSSLEKIASYGMFSF